MKEVKCKRKKHRVKKIKCSKCQSKINISECIENKDVEYLNENEGLIYCPVCGNEELIKL